jgi:transcriptional regulator with XRE-family HTH domain
MSPIVIRVKELRQARGWSQMLLAQRAGVRQASISLLESGRVRRLETDILERLAGALGVSPLELLGYERGSKQRRRMA